MKVTNAQATHRILAVNQTFNEAGSDVTQRSKIKDKKLWMDELVARLKETFSKDRGSKDEG